ncbi:MAG TPA: cold shock domain-containing protein [Pirellulales bacterium]|nr:cold shock domain-containing protein [Pirellulales bacterium]
MATGTIKRLLPGKYCGFVEPTLGGPDVFFHGSTVAGDQFATLVPGQRVEYDLDQTDAADRGPRASRVRPMQAAPPAIAPQPSEFRMLRRHPASRAKKPTWRNKAD